MCRYAATFHSYQARRLLTVHGGVGLQRASYCGRCRQIYLPYDEAMGLHDRAPAEVAEELRKLVGYFENNRHRTDYPTDRRKGWDIGRSPGHVTIDLPAVLRTCRPGLVDLSEAAGETVQVGVYPRLKGKKGPCLGVPTFG